ncbi:MAG: hypothetical protein HYV26_23575 [Candidatus Hydrogenedentes bacterium]|nr:hypothetical protein [Candidatus Hydrogenedentota bacterium]
MFFSSFPPHWNSSRLPLPLLLALCTALTVMLAPSWAAGETVGDPVAWFSELTGASSAEASAFLADLSEAGPEDLLEGLTVAEAEELLELAADLFGAEAGALGGTHSVGMASPEFREMARGLEDRMPDHLWFGQIFLDIGYTTPDQIPGEVAWLGGGGDSAIWSGHYLTAEAFRYAWARAHRNTAKNHGQAKVWEKEMARAKSRVDALVQGAHRNLNLSKNWKAQGLYTPAFDAEAGILFRNSFPEGAPAWQQNQGPGRHEYTFGPIAWDVGRNWYGQGTFTRDQYTGCMLGLLTALDFVAGDDPAMRELISQDLMASAGYLIRHGWGVVRPETNIRDATPAYQPLINGFRWGVFMSAAARHAAQVMGNLAEQAEWEALWTQSLAEQGPFVYGEDINDILNPSQSYYRFNLAHGHYFSFDRIVPDPAVRTYFRESFANMDATTHDDGNAYFEAVTYVLTGEPHRLDLAVQHLEEWLPYYERWGDGICMSCRCGIELECARRDEVTFTYALALADAVPGGEGAEVIERRVTVDGVLDLGLSVVLNGTSVVDVAVTVNGTTVPAAAYLNNDAVVVEWTQPGSNPEPRAARVLRIADERTSQDFLWQRSPYNGSGSMDREANPLERNAGVDFLLPYYMLRYYTEVETPDLEPLPAALGLTSR